MKRQKKSDDEKKRESSVMNILNCIAVQQFGNPESEKIRIIETMDYPDDVKKEAIERLRKGRD